MPKPLEQILFSVNSPIALALGIQVLGFGYKTTSTKRTFTEMKPWSLPFWSLNFVAKGGGFLESDSAGRLKIQAGEALLRFPHEPCRYGPLVGGTWDEYWLLFDGDLPRRLAGEGLWSSAFPILRPAGGQFLARFRAARNESLLPHPRAQVFAHLLVDLLFATLPLQSPRHVNTTKPEAPVRRLFDLLQAKAGEPLDRLPTLASGLGNYHSLRRAFKRHYGLAPHQALLDVKMHTARRLLLTTQATLVEIAKRVGIEDVSYFIRLFRRTFGVAPARFRRQLSEPV